MIAKVLAGRLKQVFPQTISDCQTAFVKGRQILDAILVPSTIVEEKKKKSLLEVS